MTEHSLQISGGKKRILINNDPQRVIEFDPDDILFVEKFYSILGEVQKAEEEFTSRAAELDKVSEKDEYGVPVNIQEKIEMIKDLSNWCREKIDYVFGEGTSQIAFGNTVNLDMFGQFFEGITPFIQSSRDRKLDKYKKTVPEDGKAIMD